MSAPPATEPITVVVARHVVPGLEADFEASFVGLQEAMERFPGFMGIRLIRPLAELQPEYVAIFSFASRADLDRWKQSPERQNWLERVMPFTAADIHMQHINGLQGLFTLPHSAVTLAPPRWKMVVTVSVGLYPILLVTNYYITPLLAEWPLALRLIPITLFNITLMTYAIMPFLTWLLRDWLTPNPRT